MQRWPRSLAVLAAWSTLALAVIVQPGIAQDGNEKFEKVRFHTADGVTIVGKWYKSTKTNPPVVMLLPAAGKKGEDSQKAGWDELAKTLQDKGYAVLIFDFRGHGDSTSVAPKFWANPANLQVLAERPKGNELPEEINYKNFKEQYYPVLVNDIAAAKAFLDRKNDAQQCNTSALAVIGADTGATLGAIWLNSEWSRYKYFPGDRNALVPIDTIPRMALEPEGKETIAAVWLCPSPGFGKRTVSLANTLAIPVKYKATPMTIIYSDEDPIAKKTATGCFASLNLPKGGKYQFSGPYPLDGAGKLSGRALLQPSLALDKKIADWLYKVGEKKTPEWVDRESRSSFYAWGTPQRAPGLYPALRFGSPLLSIKQKDSETMPWNSYEVFAPSR